MRRNPESIQDDDAEDDVAVDLADLVESLKREISPLGGDNFPNAVEDDYVGMLSDSFWEARLDGLLEDFQEAEGLVSPVATGGTDISRDLQQLIVFYAGFRALRSLVRNLNTKFRAKAGPVEFETAQSAAIFKELFDELKYKRGILLTRLSDIGEVPTYYADVVIQRTNSMNYGDTWWVRGSHVVSF